MSTSAEPVWANDPEFAAEVDANPALRASLERLARRIDEHIAKGNKPDYEAARRRQAEIAADYATLPPTGRTEEEARALIARHCPKRSFFR